MGSQEFKMRISRIRPISLIIKYLIRIKFVQLAFYYFTRAGGQKKTLTTCKVIKVLNDYRWFFNSTEFGGVVLLAHDDADEGCDVGHTDYAVAVEVGCRLYKGLRVAS